MFELRPRPFDHPDAVRLIAGLQAYYCEVYGGEDATPIDPRHFDPPAGYFVVGYADGVGVACGGWRVREDDPVLRVGDAEIKRMFVLPAHRGRGYARAILAHLEESAAAAGRRRIVLETGTVQPAAMALYVDAGYTPIPSYGSYRDDPQSRCFARTLRQDFDSVAGRLRA